MFYVYVLKDEQSGKIYTGQTADPEKRLLRHNGELKSKARSYTKINKEEYTTRSEVLLREKYLKSHIGRDWLKNKIEAR